ncbi:MAG: AAA family ATPase [Phycisphaerae bacterium]
MKLRQVRIDGYKNLINAVLDLGDFNVLVGPNNSGKSNLLEAIQMLGGICFGDDKLRNAIFAGCTPPSRWGISKCHLEKYSDKPISIGISFEINVNNEVWHTNYDVTIKCDISKNDNYGFVSEILTAKQPSTRGAATTYIKRENKELIVCGKTHGIAQDNSSLLAIQSLYPDFEGLPEAVKKSLRAINEVGTLSIYSISTNDMRADIGREKSIKGVHVSSFDLPFVLNKIKEETSFFNVFKEYLCKILEIEDLKLFPIGLPIDAKKNSKDDRRKQVFLLAKRKGSDFSLIDEYSDGTFAAAALLAILIWEGNKGRMLFIEEPENYLHPKALEKVTMFLQDNAEKWPVLITTHSPYLLNCVKNPEDVKVAVVDEDGSTHFEPVRNSKTLRDYLKSGFMSFGDMLPSNFKDVLGGQRSVKTKTNSNQ